MSGRLSKSAIYPRDLHPGTFVARKRGCLKTEQSEEIPNQDKVVSVKLGGHREEDNVTEIKKNNTQPLKKVSFHIAELQHYDRLPGDNPSVSAGVALSLGWEVLDVQVYSVEDYEGQIGVTRTRRYRKDLALSREEREQLLHDDWGFSLRELFDASEISREAKQKRIQTLLLLRKPRLRKFDEIIENSVRKFDRLLNPRSQDVKQLLLETEARDSCLEINPTFLGETTSNHSSIGMTRSESVPILSSLDRSQQFSGTVKPNLRIFKRPKSSEDLRDVPSNVDKASVTDELNEEVQVSKPIKSFLRLKPRQVEEKSQGVYESESSTLIFPEATTSKTTSQNKEAQGDRGKTTSSGFKLHRSLSLPSFRGISSRLKTKSDNLSCSISPGFADELNNEVSLSKSMSRRVSSPCLANDFQQEQTLIFSSPNLVPISEEESLFF